MPLTAVHNGKQVVSIFMTDDDWAQVRNRTSRGSLNMSCGVPATPKVSSQGLRHFAHKKAVECGHPGCTETPEHQAAKAAVAKAAAEAGWNVTIEHRAPGGEWVADVLAEKDSRRVALEIQWSRQTSEDFSYRQERYRKAGVECLWFIHRTNRTAAAEAKVPFAVLTGDRAPFGIEAAAGIFKDEEPTLESAVTEALEGVGVEEALIRIGEVEFNLDPMDCTLCGQVSTTWRISALQGVTLCGKTVQIPGDYKMWSTEKHEALFVSEAAMALAAAPVEEGPWPPLTRLRMFYSRTAGTTYLAQGCAHCARGVHGDFFVSQSDGALVKVAARSKIEVRSEATHICVDRGEGVCSTAAPVPGDSRPKADEPEHQVLSIPEEAWGDIRLMNRAKRLINSSTGRKIALAGAIRAAAASGPRGSVDSRADIAETVDPRAYLQSCDRCTPANPCDAVHECLCRRLEAVSLSADGYWHHICDSISSGDRGDEGVELLHRLLKRAVDSRVLHGPGGAHNGRTAPHLHYQGQAA